MEGFDILKCLRLQTKGRGFCIFPPPQLLNFVNKRDQTRLEEQTLAVHGILEQLCRTCLDQECIISVLCDYLESRYVLCAC